MEERLQKRIAESGICSRRKAEELILEGKVKVNGKIVTTLGTKVRPGDEIAVNDKIITKENKFYYVINKPRGILCTLSDPMGRKTILDILPDKIKEERIYPVGRLDSDTKGVLLLTNDGNFMNALVGPKSGIEKEYLARIKGMLSLSDVKKLSTGVKINNKMTLPALVNIVSKDTEHDSTLVSITLTEGGYHQVKEMFLSTGHVVKKLTRVRFGHITIDNLKEGEVVRLPIKDVKILLTLAKNEKNLGKRNNK